MSADELAPRYVILVAMQLTMYDKSVRHHKISPNLRKTTQHNMGKFKGIIFVQ